MFVYLRDKDQWGIVKRPNPLEIDDASMYMMMMKLPDMIKQACMDAVHTVHKCMYIHAYM